MRALAGLAIACALASAPAFGQSPVGGATEWLQTPSGKLKAQTFEGPHAGAHPVLVVALHGDAPFNKPSYQYAFARQAAVSGRVVAAAILRPGYTDPTGDKSAGQRGPTTGDNYTRDRIDMIVAGIRELQKRHHARAVILVGHSGGAAISADILALYPDLARAALLVSCPCDLSAWRAHMKALQHAPIWDQPVNSLSPITLAAQAPKAAVVRMVVGSVDGVAPPEFTRAYAQVLRARGVDVKVTELPGKDHEIFLEPAVQEELKALVTAVGR